MEKSKEVESNTWLLKVLIGCSIIAIVLAFYLFYYQKNYDFIVEVSCDPYTEGCFQRDCSEEGFCPPNELSTFKRYSLKASDFGMCANEDCEMACESEIIKCEPVECVTDLEIGEFCTSSGNSTINE